MAAHHIVVFSSGKASTTWSMPCGVAITQATGMRLGLPVVRNALYHNSMLTPVASMGSAMISVFSSMLGVARYSTWMPTS